MTDLLDHIRSINAETQAWIEAGEGRWAGMLVEDLDHWAEQGVFTAEDFQRRELETYIYEGHKDAFGTKGRHYDFASMTMEDLEKEAAYISDAVATTMNEEARRADEALAAFNTKLAEIQDLAGDRETALRWYIESLETEFYHKQDIESVVWNEGILFTEEGRALVDELEALITYKDWDYE